MRVAIIGGGDSRLDCPFDDPGIIIWAINNCYQGLPRVDAVLEIHPIFGEGAQWWRRGEKEFRGMAVEKYLQELNSLGVPVYLQKRIPIIRNSISYPLKEIIEKFQTKYFSSSVSLAIALALYQEAKEIQLYGINMAANEYQKQRPSCEYWIGRAEGMGVKVAISKTSSLLFGPIYGFDETTPSLMLARRDLALSQIKRG